MNICALVVAKQTGVAMRSRAVYRVRSRHAAPGFHLVLQQSSASSVQSAAGEPAGVKRGSATAARADRHTVREGENLSTIVRDQLEKQGRQPSVQEIVDGVNAVARANGLDNADLIHPGQQLDLTPLKAEALTGAGGPAAARRLQGAGAVSQLVAGILGASADLTETSPPDALWQGILGAEGELSSGYGMRRDPFTGERRFHHGLDIAAPTGTPIQPVGSGEVVFSGWRKGYGRMVTVRHEDGTESIYAHTSKNLVREGDRVDPEDTIALVGSTGRSTGPHLHLEIRQEDESVDPGAYLRQDRVLLAQR